MRKPKLLLHACCAPCSTAVYEKLCSGFDLTVYWYNPNIFPAIEHDKRLGELTKLSKLLDFKLVIDPSSGEDYSPWKDGAKALIDEPEGGKRCHYCYRFRLAKAQSYAQANKFDYFSTTLTVSPYKNTPKIIEIGKELETKNSPKFLAEDFKKAGGYQRSIELSKQYNLYRQNYCGCEYSIKMSKSK